MRTFWKLLLLFLAVESVPTVLLIETYTRPQHKETSAERPRFRELELTLSPERKLRPLEVQPEVERELDE